VTGRLLPSNPEVRAFYAVLDTLMAEYGNVDREIWVVCVDDFDGVVDAYRRTGWVRSFDDLLVRSRPFVHLVRKGIDGIETRRLMVSP
jgi:hypothetical protein